MNNPAVAASIGHNKAPIVDPEITERMDVLIDNTSRWLTERPEFTSEEQANQARDFIQQLRDEASAADKSRLEATKPSRDRTKEVNDTWNTLISKLKACADALNRPMTAWLQAEQRKAQEAQALQEEEAREAERLAEEKRRAAEASTDIRDQFDADEADRVAADAATRAAAPVKINIAGNVSGRSMGLRETRHGEITDIDKLFAKFRDHADVSAVLLKLANKEIRSGAKRVPGIRIVTEQKAA